MKNLVVLLLWIIPFISIAQKNFRPGYIVNLKGDTISGFIDYREWRSSPTGVLFKTADNDAMEKVYGVNDLSFFRINGMESYRRSVVKISLHPAKIDEVGSRDTSWKIDTVFLKMIHYGKLASLLSYTDQLKERFYILEEGQKQPEELIVREYLRDGATSLIRETGYKIQMRNLLNKQGTYTNELSNKIEEAAYEEDDLKKIVVLINRASDKTQDEDKKVRRAFWFAGIGLQRNNLNFLGDHIMARNPNTSQSSWLPSVAAGVDLFRNPNVGKLFFRFEAGYQINKSSITTSLPDDEKAVFSLSGSTLTLRSQLNFVLYNTPKLKIPVGAGALFSFMNFSKNQYKKIYANGSEGNFVEDWLDLNKSTTTLFGRASVVFNNKIEASFVYSPYVRLTKTIAYRVTSNNMQLQVYYLFR